jgi:hypothetical protein
VLDTMRSGTQAAMKALIHDLREGEWPELDAPAVFHLTIALEQIIQFLDRCVLREGDRVISVFQTRSQDILELALWFYVKWWSAVGMRNWLMEVCRDEAVFYRYFQRPRDDYAS